MRAGVGVLVLAALLLTGCGQEQASPPVERGPKPHLVEVVQVAPRQVAVERSRSGTLRSARVVEIHTQEAGRITALPWHPGDRVATGELLASLDDSLLSAQLTRARAGLREARQNLERLRQLAANRLVSREELLRRETEADVAAADVQLLETRLSYTRIHAPFDAVVTERLSEPGNIASVHSHLLTLADPEQLLVDVTVSELILAQLQVDDPVGVIIDAIGADPYPARVSRIYPEVDPVTRRGTLEVRLDPVPVGARAGQFVRVQLKTAERERLLVPFNALRFESGTYLYVVDARGIVQPQTVVTGSRLADEIEILDGLAPGDQVVVRGFLGLAPGKSVKIVGAAVPSATAQPPVSASGGDHAG